MSLTVISSWLSVQKAVCSGRAAPQTSTPLPVSFPRCPPLCQPGRAPPVALPLQAARSAPPGKSPIYPTRNILAITSRFFLQLKLPHSLVKDMIVLFAAVSD